jgi:hypothetical protein
MAYFGSSLVDIYLLARGEGSALYIHEDFVYTVHDKRTIDESLRIKIMMR